MKRIVFDAGGVLIRDSSTAAFIRLVSEELYLDADAHEAYYRQYLHIPLMLGEISEPEFWQQVVTRLDIGQDQIPHLRHRLIHEAMYSLPAFDKLGYYAEHAELWLLSNHVSEWIEAKFSPFSNLFHTMLVSSETGARKPDMTAYTGLLASSLDTIYIDDKELNLLPAKKLGYTTLLAHGNWIEKLDEWLVATI